MPELTGPGEAHALDVEASPFAPLMPMSATVSNFASGTAHWKDEGHLTLYKDEVMIISGAREGWEDKLAGLGVQAVRLDPEHIAVKVPG